LQPQLSDFRMLFLFCKNSLHRVIELLPQLFLLFVVVAVFVVPLSHSTVAVALSATLCSTTVSFPSHHRCRRCISLGFD